MRRSQLDPVRNLLMRELIGIRVRVDEHPDRRIVGLEGAILDETKNMLLLDGIGKRKWVPKSGAVFSFHLMAEGLDEWVVVQGIEIMFRPEDRTKRCERQRTGENRVRDVALSGDANEDNGQ